MGAYHCLSCSRAFIPLGSIDGYIKRNLVRLKSGFLIVITVRRNRKPKSKQSFTPTERERDGDHDDRGRPRRRAVPRAAEAGRPVPGREELRDVLPPRARRRPGDVARALPRRVAVARRPRPPPPQKHVVPRFPSTKQMRNNTICRRDSRVPFPCIHYPVINYCSRLPRSDEATGAQVTCKPLVADV
jgi:hypothetical protein